MSGKRALRRWASGALLAVAIGIAAAGCAIVPYGGYAYDPYPYAYAAPGIVVAPSVVVGGGYHHGGHGRGGWHRGGFRHR